MAKETTVNANEEETMDTTEMVDTDLSIEAADEGEPQLKPAVAVKKNRSGKLEVVDGDTGKSKSKAAKSSFLCIRSGKRWANENDLEYAQRKEYERNITKQYDQCEANIALAKSLKQLAIQMLNASDNLLDESIDVRNKITNNESLDVEDLERQAHQYEPALENLYFLLTSSYDSFVKYVFPINFRADVEHPEDTKPLVDIHCVVSCVETTDFVIIKTPHLMSKQNKHKGESYHAYPPQRIFSQEVTYSISETVSDITRFEKKNISVISIYSKDRYSIPDNDNLNTKYIIDGICEAGFCGDGALICSVFMHSAIMPDIQEGAYFIVSEGVGKVPPIDIIYEALRKNFHA